MVLALARRRCPAALVLPPRPELYRRALGRCLEHALHYTPLVEPAGGQGHLYLDVSGTRRLFGQPADIGRRLRTTLRQDLGLDPIWSVAPNKLLAKVASRLVKPCGEYLVAGGAETTFLAPLPLPLLPGLLPGDLDRLGRVNIRRVHQAAALSVAELAVLCDGRARHIHQTVRGVDPTPVVPAGTGRADLQYRHTFAPDSNDERLVRSALAALVQQAGCVLRGRGLGCRRVGVQLVYTDGLTVVRQATSTLPVDDDCALEQLARTALYRAWHRRTRLRSLALCCDRLLHPVRQLSLFAPADPGRERQRSLSAAMDAIRARCGDTAILRGSRRTPDASTAAA
jgi:DNA polymerase-4